MPGQIDRGRGRGSFEKIRNKRDLTELAARRQVGDLETSQLNASHHAASVAKVEAITVPKAIRTKSAASGASQELVASTIQNGTMIIPTNPRTTGDTSLRC